MTRRETIEEILKNELRCSAASLQEGSPTLEQLGADSLDLIEMCVKFEDEFGVDIPESMENGCAGTTVEYWLKFLEEQLGPEFPTDGLLVLTDDQFDLRYVPEKDPVDGSYYRMRYWDNAADVEAIDAAIPEHRAWTAVDNDEGEFCVIEGVHRVNRICYIITEKPLEDPSWSVEVVFPKIDEEGDDAP